MPFSETIKTKLISLYSANEKIKVFYDGKKPESHSGQVIMQKTISLYIWSGSPRLDAATCLLRTQTVLAGGPSGTAAAAPTAAFDRYRSTDTIKNLFVLLYDGAPAL